MTLTKRYDHHGVTSHDFHYKGRNTKASTRDLACPIPEGQLLANLQTGTCTVFECLHIYIECGVPYIYIVK